MSPVPHSAWLENSVLKMRYTGAGISSTVSIVGIGWLIASFYWPVSSSVAVTFQGEAYTPYSLMTLCHALSSDNYMQAETSYVLWHDTSATNTIRKNMGSRHLHLELRIKHMEQSYPHLLMGKQERNECLLVHDTVMLYLLSRRK